MSKKDVIAFVRSNGYDCTYSGITKKYYISKPKQITTINNKPIIPVYKLATQLGAMGITNFEIK